MQKRQIRSRPEFWLVVLAFAGIFVGVLATYRNDPGFLRGNEAYLPHPQGSEAQWRIQDEENTVEVFEAAKRGVVMVSTTRRSGDSSALSSRGNGSGFFIDNDGHIVTNNHVIQGSDTIEAHTFSGKSYKATVVGSDRLTDLAVLKIEAPADEIHPLSLADYDTVEVGQKAVVLGSPLATGSALGLDRSPTVTTGIISAKDRSLPIESLTKPNVNDFSIENLIQTDAAVNPGNSGGPLLNSRGEVAGVVTAIIQSANGIGFAIPSNVVAEVVPQILATGQVKRAYIGVSYYPLDVLAKDMSDEALAKLGLGAARGALVTDVAEGGPADKAGIRPCTKTVSIDGLDYPIGGDIITGIDGIDVDGSRLSQEITKHMPGDKVKVDILRDGQRIAVEVVLGSR